MSGSAKSASNSRVLTTSRLAKWRIKRIFCTNSRRSNAFKIGIWNWYLFVEERQNVYIEERQSVYIRLCPVSCQDRPPIAKFVIRVSTNSQHQPYTSPVNEKLLRSFEDFVWPIEHIKSWPFVRTLDEHLTVVVEFLDLKISSLTDGEPYSIWPSQELLGASLSKSNLRCLSFIPEYSFMAEDGIHTHLTIETSGGALKAHKNVLASCSPVFKSMFSHDLKEKQSSTIKIVDMPLESCLAFLSYIYGVIKPEEFWKNRTSLLVAANKYDMPDLKDLCEENLLEDISTNNVLERLQKAWLYHLHKLKRACLSYLYDFDKAHDIGEEISDFFQQADRELLFDMFQGALEASSFGLIAFDKAHDIGEEISDFFQQADRELLFDMFQGALEASSFGLIA